MEADDFKVDVNKKWFRLAPGRVVRLKSAYIVEYGDHVEDESGAVTEVHVNYFSNSKSGQDVSGIKAKGTLHWVSCEDAVNAEVRLYDRMFLESAPEANGDFMDCLNPSSLEVRSNCKLEPSLAHAEPGTVYQFTRLGYFTVDSRYSEAENLVFNRAVTLKDGWKG